MRLFRKSPEVLHIYCDGGLGSKGKGSGVGVVIRNETGEVIGLAKRKLPPMTNNAAEYAALVLALEAARKYCPDRLEIFMDSENVVRQMQGRYRVNSPDLREWHSRACCLVRNFKQVTFTHIPRSANRLADALAGEALNEEVGGGE